MIRVRILTALAAAWGVALSQVAAADTESAAPTFVVGSENNFYFPHFGFSDGTFVGFAREVLDAFAADRGYTFVYEPFPVRRLFSQLLDGHIDFKYPDNPHWQSDLKAGSAVAYSAPVAAYVDGVSVRPEVVGQGIDALTSLSTVRGFTVVDYRDRIAAGQLSVVENDTFLAAAKMVLRGRVVGVYANVDVVEYTVSELLKRPGALVFDSTLPHTRDFYSLSTVKHPEVVAELDTWMTAHRAWLLRKATLYHVEVPPR